MAMNRKQKQHVSMTFADLVEWMLYSSFSVMSFERLNNSRCLNGNTILSSEGDCFVKSKSIGMAIVKPSDMVGRQDKYIDLNDGELSHGVAWRPSLKEISTARKTCELFRNRMDSENVDVDELMFRNVVKFDKNNEMTFSVRSACGWSEAKQKIVSLGDLDSRVHKELSGKVTVSGYRMSKNHMAAQADIILSIYWPTWWRLRVSVSNSPTIEFATTPRSALALLSSRDLENGKTRRDALLHWVRTHERTAGVGDSDAKVMVKEFLRGKTAAVFGDLKIEIVENTVVSTDMIENIMFA